MFCVFVAMETALGRGVVVKVLAPEWGHAVSAERFRREIRLAARLQNPAILPPPQRGRRRRTPPLHHALRRGQVAPATARALPAVSGRRGHSPAAGAVTR